MTEKERFARIDRAFHRDEIAPILPAKVLDFHAHLWSSKNWRNG